MIIEAKVVPKAKLNKISRLDDTHYHIYTTTAPDKGKANESVIKLLAKELNLPKSKLKIIGGQKYHNKLIQIED